jgi:hypothetical protein
MAFLVSVQPLRSRGKKLADAAAQVEGYLLTERRGATLAVSVVSNVGGTHLLGPLFEPRLGRADVDSLVLIGFESQDEAAFVQEWRLGPYTGQARAAGWVASPRG